MITSILAATDGSEHAEKAVLMAAELAGKTDARLTLLHVCKSGELSPEERRFAEAELLAPNSAAAEPAPALLTIGEEFSEFTQPATIDRSRAFYRAIGNQILSHAKAIAHAAGAGDIETCIEDGDPAEEILRQAQQSEADLIVLGSRGLGGVGELFLGSVSHKVSQLAHCACLTVK